MGNTSVYPHTPQTAAPRCAARLVSCCWRTLPCWRQCALSCTPPRANARPLGGWLASPLRLLFFFLEIEKHRTLFSFLGGLTLYNRWWCLLKPISFCLSSETKTVNSIVFLNVYLYTCIDMNYFDPVLNFYSEFRLYHAGTASKSE